MHEPVAFAALLGLVFTAGMIATDAPNGLWVSGLVGRADARTAAASRSMSYAIATAALAVAYFAAMRRAFRPAAARPLS